MLNWSYISEVIPIFEQALWLTCCLSLESIVVALIIGLITSGIIFYRVPFLSNVAKIYVSFFRNTPLLLHLFFIYYGLPRAFNIVLNFEITALISLSLLGGSYMAESFRASLAAVTKSQRESGIALGLNKLQLFRYILLPQAISYSVPTLGANCIFMFKETSVFTAIAGTDVTTTAAALINTHGQSNENLLLLVVAYSVIILPFIILLSYIEKRVRYAEFGY